MIQKAERFIKQKISRTQQENFIVLLFCFVGTLCMTLMTRKGELTSCYNFLFLLPVLIFHCLDLSFTLTASCFSAICSRYQVNRRRVIPLPLYKADPKKHQSALFKKEQVHKELVDMIDFLSISCLYSTFPCTATHGSDYFT